MKLSPKLNVKLTGVFALACSLQALFIPGAYAQEQGEAGAQVAQAVAQTLVEKARVGAAEHTLTHANIPGGPLMLVSYAALWAFVFVMIFLTLRRQRKLNAELEGLSRRMDEVFAEVEG